MCIFLQVNIEFFFIQTVQHCTGETKQNNMRIKLMNTEIKRFITYGFFRFSPIHKYKTVNKKYILKKMKHSTVNV